jgi:hypothetical protein
MDPITIAILALLTGAIGCGGAGYAFGSARKEARFKQLQEQIAKQAQILAALERRLESLCNQVQTLQESRGIFRRFMWFVFKSDPKLFEAFLDLQQTERQRAGVHDVLATVVTTLRGEYPDHPGVKTLGTIMVG